MDLQQPQTTLRAVFGASLMGKSFTYARLISSNSTA